MYANLENHLTRILLSRLKTVCKYDIAERHLLNLFSVHFQRCYCYLEVTFHVCCGVPTDNVTSHDGLT